MRLLTLLPAALFLSPFAAAQDSLRAEIRKIVREEIRAAMQELHGAPAAKVVEGKKVAPGKVVAGKIVADSGLWTTTVQGSDGAKASTVFGKIVDGKPVEVGPFESKPIEVRIADQTAKWEEVPTHSFRWVTGEKADAAGGKILHLVGDKPVEVRTKGLKVQNVKGQPIEVREIQKQIETELGDIMVHFQEDGPDKSATKGNVFYFHPSTGNQQVKIVKVKGSEAKTDGAPTECQVECKVECTTDTKQATSSCCEAAKATAECCEAAKATSECCEGEKCEECVVEVKAEKATKKQKKEGGKKKNKKAKPAEKVEEFELKIG